MLQDLLKLETEGVDLGGRWGVRKGSVVFILGDNLGSHIIISGYVENFSNVSHWCRYCLFPKSDLGL